MPEDTITQLITKPWKAFTEQERQMWDVIGEEHRNSKRPNKDTNPAAWNAHFEREIMFKYRSYEQPPYPQIPESLLRSTSYTDLAQVNVRLVVLTKALWDGEGRLIALAKVALFDTGFEAACTSWTPTRKAALLLEGLYRGACEGENGRIWCPEMTIAGLVQDGEFGLITMLKAIMMQDCGGSRIHSLCFFPHPFVAKELEAPANAPELVKGVLYHELISRNLYIVEALMGILDAHLGYNPTRVRRSNLWPPTTCDEKPQWKEELNDSERYACSGCGKECGVAELRRCGECKSVWYCSTQCQQRDWKKQHKRICKLKYFDASAVAPKHPPPPEFTGCPPIAAGFVRTPALWRQIWYLSKDDSQMSDYHFERDLRRSRSFNMPHAGEMLRMNFLVSRRRAMATGSRAAVAAMATIIRMPFVSEECGIPADEMLEQLTREYGIRPFADWTDVALTAMGDRPITPSSLEVREEVAFRERRAQRFEELYGPITDEMVEAQERERRQRGAYQPPAEDACVIS
ncbi:hypothetical protein C8F01DRAFT_1351816 [Mycena amicta]|nr:hypothetical protein C8F01DRAFT_1351816 [Mycena amicta]